MSEPLAASIAAAAAALVELSHHRAPAATLDYSPASLATVEQMADEAAHSLDTLSPGQLTGLVQDIGSYLLEVGRREFGGAYFWHELRDQPVLVVGEPLFHVALMTWDKVRDRLAGDPADNLPFFYDGFATQARQAIPGSHAIYL